MSKYIQSIPSVEKQVANKTKSVAKKKATVKKTNKKTKEK
jgi:hypothetical protein